MAVRPITERITDELLECGICFCEYKDPKMLPCQHAYCQGCLESLIGQCRLTDGERSILCPMCRTPAKIPDTGSAEGFQTAFHINKIFELRNTLGKQSAPHHPTPVCTCRHRNCHNAEVTHFCDTCGPLCHRCITSHRELYCYHKVVQIAPICAHHSTLYCKTCDTPVCSPGSHQEHTYEHTQLSYRQKCELHVSLSEVQKKRVELKMALMNVKETNRHVSNHAIDVKSNIETTFRRLEELLEQRKKDLLNLTDNLTKKKLACLDTQMEILTDIHEEICNYAMFIEQCIANKHHADFINLKAAMSLYWSTQSHKYADIQVEDSNLQFYLSECSIPDFQTLGVVSASSASPSNCLAEGSGLTTATIGEKALFEVSIRKQDNKPCMDSSGDVHAFLKHNSFDTYLDAQLVELKGNMMTFSYQHQQPGEYQLHVQVCGKEINSSPFKVIMRRPFTFKGDFIRRFVRGELKQPWGVACISNGNIAVVDHEGEKGVTIFDADGKMVSSFMEAMGLLNFWGPKGKCYRPSGIAVDCNDDILVVDGGMHRIQKFSIDGRLLNVVGSCGSGELQFREPVGIQVNAGSEVYVCDRRNDRIQVLDKNLSFLRTFGCGGDQDGQLICPWDVAFDSSQDVYITDSGNNRVQVFTPDGTFLRKFGCKGDGRGQFRDLRNICIDQKDDVYVTDCTHHRVTVFTSSGEVLTTVSAGGIMNGPLGISIDRDGLVYIADSANRSIGVYL